MLDSVDIKDCKIANCVVLLPPYTLFALFHVFYITRKSIVAQPLALGLQLLSIGIAEDILLSTLSNTVL